MAYTPPDVVPLTGFEKNKLTAIFQPIVVQEPEVRLLVPDFISTLRHSNIKLDKERTRLRLGNSVLLSDALANTPVPLDGSNKIEIGLTSKLSIYTVVGTSEFNGTFKVVLNFGMEGSKEVDLDSVVPLSLIGKMSLDNSSIVINPKLLKVAEKISHIDLNGAQREERSRVQFDLYMNSLEKILYDRYGYTSILRLNHRAVEAVEEFLKSVSSRIEARLVDPLTDIQLKDLVRDDIVYFEEIDEENKRYVGIVQYIDQSKVEGVGLPKCMVREINKFTGKLGENTISYDLNTILKGYVFKPKEFREMLRVKERLNRESRKEMKLVLLDLANIKIPKWFAIQ